MTEIPADAPRSDDGNYWWDGDAWQPVEGAAASTSDTDSGSDSGSDEVTPEQLEPAADTGAEPGNEEALTEKTKPYFEAFDADEDAAEAEVAAALNEDDFAGEVA